MIRPLIGLMVLAISGCSWIGGPWAETDNAIPPAPLSSIDNPLPVQRIWSMDLGAGQRGGFVQLEPATDGRRVYAVSHRGRVVAADARTGEVAWQVDTGLTASAGVGVGDGLVLVAGNRGEVVALRADAGEESWRRQMSSEVLAPPVSAAGVTVVRSIDGRFTGLDARSGEPLWSYSYTMPVLTVRGSSRPLVGQGLVLSGLENGRVLALDLASGAALFERALATPRGRTDLERMVDLDSTPRVVGNMLYITGYRGNVSALDLSDGNVRWARNISSHAGLDADTARVYVSDDDSRVLALDAVTGATMWQQDALIGRRLTAPAVVGRYLVVGDLEGYVHWLDATSGRVVGRVRADDQAVLAAPRVVDGTVFVQGQGGRLTALRSGA